MSDPEREVLLEAFIADHLILLWERMFVAQRRAINGRWSMECDALGADIAAASALVGPVSWRDIGMMAIVDGTFERTVRRIGLSEQAFPSDAEVERCRQLIYSSVRSGLT